MTSTDNHEDVRLEVESFTRGPSARVVVRGEADAGNLGRLDAALDAVVLDGHTTVHVDLSELDFIDVPALRLLTAFAVAWQQSGHEVTTFGAPPLVRRTAEILDVQGQLGLA